MKYNHDNDFMECQQTPMLFTGEIKGIQDVMKMMYRGEVKLTLANLKIIMKFSVVYACGVPEMYEICR